MRRVIPVVIALLASFHTSPGTAPTTPTVKSAGGQPASGASPPPGSSATTSSAPGGTAPAAPKQFDGPVVENQYGPVQVRVTVAGGKVTDVAALQLPQDRQRSAEISQFAEPLLRSEALSAQSANIDLVSGATFTSDSYAQSLQAALDRAGIH